MCDNFLIIFSDLFYLNWMSSKQAFNANVALKKACVYVYHTYF